MNMDEFARKFAEIAHQGQKYGDLPYTVHLAAVVQILTDFGFSEDFRIAGWLHDVIEDTPVNDDIVELMFGHRVKHLVWAVTGVGKNRKQRVEDAHRKINDYVQAVVIKLADRIANAEASAKDNPRLLVMYRGEYPAFKANLKEATFQASGYNEIQRSTLDDMWGRLDKVLG